MKNSGLFKGVVCILLGFIFLPWFLVFPLKIERKVIKEDE